MSKVPSTKTLILTLNLIPYKSNKKWALVREWLASSHRHHRLEHKFPLFRHLANKPDKISAYRGYFGETENMYGTLHYFRFIASELLHNLCRLCDTHLKCLFAVRENKAVFSSLLDVTMSNSTATSQARVDQHTRNIPG